MLFKYFLFGILIFKITSSHLIAQEISDTNHQKIVLIEENGSSIKKNVGWDEFFDANKHLKVLLREALFITRTFFIYVATDYLMNKMGRKNSINFSEALLYCLISELAYQAEGFPSFFKETDKKISTNTN